MNVRLESPLPRLIGTRDPFSPENFGTIDDRFSGIFLHRWFGYLGLVNSEINRK